MSVMWVGHAMPLNAAKKIANFSNQSVFETPIYFCDPQDLLVPAAVARLQQEGPKTNQKVQFHCQLHDSLFQYFFLEIAIFLRKISVMCSKLRYRQVQGLCRKLKRPTHTFMMLSVTNQTYFIVQINLKSSFITILWSKEQKWYQPHSF